MGITGKIVKTKKPERNFNQALCNKVSDYRTLIEDFVKVIEFMKYINFMGMVR